MLADGEQAAGEVTAVIREEFGISQPAVSMACGCCARAGWPPSGWTAPGASTASPRPPLQEVDAWLERYRRFWAPHLDALATELARGRRERLQGGSPPAGRSAAQPKEDERPMAHDGRRRRSPGHRAHRRAAHHARRGGPHRRPATHLRRPVEEVWDALTDPQRIVRWFLPITGDLRLGGTYQLEGNAGGKILRCEPPHSLLVTWAMGEDTGASQVEVRLSPAGEGRPCPAGPRRGGAAGDVGRVRPRGGGGRLGPGAGGPEPCTCRTPSATKPEGGGILARGEQFVLLSSAAWGPRSRHTGADSAQVDKAVANTTAFYAPDPGPAEARRRQHLTRSVPPRGPLSSRPRAVGWPCHPVDVVRCGRSLAGAGGRGTAMPTYVTLYKWTEQGIHGVRDTVDRADQVAAAGEALGGRIIGVWWTQGAYDLVVVSDWPDEEAAMAQALRVAMAGNVRSETLRAFDKEDMRRILGRLRLTWPAGAPREGDAYARGRHRGRRSGCPALMRGSPPLRRTQGAQRPRPRRLRGRRGAPSRRPRMSPLLFGARPPPPPPVAAASPLGAALWRALLGSPQARAQACLTPRPPASSAGARAPPHAVSRGPPRPLPPGGRVGSTASSAAHSPSGAGVRAWRTFASTSSAVRGPTSVTAISGRRRLFSPPPRRGRPPGPGTRLHSACARAWSAGAREVRRARRRGGRSPPGARRRRATR